jgi:SdpC family antimicrobial peptide
VPLGERTAADDPKALADQVDRYAETLCKQGCSDTARDGLRAAAERIRSGEEEQLVGPDPNTAFTRTRGPAVDAAISAVVADIASQDPAFLDRFGADMQSGNPIRVKRAVEDASHRILEAAVHVQRDTRGALDLGAHPQARPNEGDGDDSPVIVYLVVAVVVLLAVVAVLPEPQVQRVGDGLTYDRFIANLTDHLQHS